MRYPFLLAASIILVAVPARAAVAAPEGQITIAVHVSLAPTWFDPAETPGVITPFMTLSTHVVTSGAAGLRPSTC